MTSSYSSRSSAGGWRSSRRAQATAPHQHNPRHLYRSSCLIPPDAESASLTLPPHLRLSLGSSWHLGLLRQSGQTLRIGQLLRIYLSSARSTRAAATASASATIILVTDVAVAAAAAAAVAAAEEAAAEEEEGEEEGLVTVAAEVVEVVAATGGERGRSSLPQSRVSRSRRPSSNAVTLNGHRARSYS